MKISNGFIYYFQNLPVKMYGVIFEPGRGILLWLFECYCTYLVWKCIHEYKTCWVFLKAENQMF
jgi:hypothetical protein